jgi:hypothetical protein
MLNMMTSYVIMHNMIVENEQDDFIYDQSWDFQDGVASWKQFMHIIETSHDRHIHNRLQTDLIEHIWAFAGNQHG